MAKLRILLADDHPIVAEGLRGLLEPQYDLVGTVENGRELLTATKKLKPDIVIADISMPQLNGIDALGCLKRAGIQVKFIFLSMHTEAIYAKRALATGASGYVLKASAPSELLVAIRRAVLGRIYVSPKILSMLGGTNWSDTESLDSMDELTPRQCEVLQLLTEGRSAKEIARSLFISPRTVEYHKYRMMEVLSISSGAELVRFAIENGVCSPALGHSNVGSARDAGLASSFL